jgi:outer membrane protein assembly factor BamB
VLGVETSATTMQIRSAYREKAKRAHPDAGGDPAAFRRLLEAYQTLTNDRDRRAYDERMGIGRGPTGSTATAPGRWLKDTDFNGDVEFPAYLRDITDRPWEKGVGPVREPTLEEQGFRDPGGAALPADVVWWWPDKAVFLPTTNGPLLVTATPKAVVAIAALDGREAWRTELGSPLASPPVTAGDVVVAWTHDGNLHALDVGTGAIRWQVSLGASSPGGLVAAGTTVAAARADARLVGVDAASGKAVWSSRLQAAATAPMTIDDTFIIAIAGGRVIEAVDARKGRHRWRVTVKTPVPLPAAIAEESIWLSGGGRTGALVRLDRTTGALQGMADSGTAVAGMAPADGYVFATGAGPARLRVFDERGIVRVELGLPNVCPEPAVGPDRAFLADPTGRIITIDRAIGQPIDVATVPFEPIGAPLLVGDRLVMLARDGRLWAVAEGR